jgi:WD40 repeat protein
MLTKLILAMFLLGSIRTQNPIRLVHTEALHSAVWSPDGQWVASWTAHDLYLWNTHALDEPLIFAQETAIQGAAWHPQSDRIVTWAEDEVARLWFPEGDPVMLLHEGRVSGATWNQDGSRLLTWSWDGSARVWPAGGIGDPLVFAQQGEWIRALLWAAWSDDERFILATYGGDDFIGETVLVWSVESGELFSLRHELWVNGMIPGAGDRVLTWSGDGKAKLWSLAEPDQPLIVFEHEAQVYHAAWNGGSLFATIDEHGTARIWDITDPQHPIRLFMADRAGGVIAHPDAELVFAVWTTEVEAHVNEVRLLGLGPEMTDPVVLYHASPIRGVLWGSAQLLTQAADNTVRVYQDLWNYSPAAAFVLPHDETIQQAVFSPDGSTVLVQGEKTLYLWALNHEE